MAIKLNNEDSYERLCNVKLTKDKFPLAFEAKVNELTMSGLSREEAERAVPNMEIELEVYYSPNLGLFAVETDAVDNGATIYDPYTGEQCEPYDTTD